MSASLSLFKMAESFNGVLHRTPHTLFKQRLKSYASRAVALKLASNKAEPSYHFSRDLMLFNNLLD